MNPAETQLQTHLTQLKLVYVQEHYQSLADQAAQQHWTQVDYLSRLIGPGLRKSTGRRFKISSGWPFWKTTPTSSSWAEWVWARPTWPLR